ncbi:MAG: competence/damage-inducible protein A, partial [Burkholderiaceae bacterium]|nr:competence/damage-inducible protein A [Burkholderiaceae bacterium]
VGDEILSGKRQDKHFARVLEMLGGRGLRLSWAHYVGDEREQLTVLLTRSFASGDAVFCCGGIGATPDDHTRQAAAAALGVALELHPEAARLIAERTAEMAREGRGSADMSLPENRQRLKMGEFPAGAEIVPNPFNRIPGFAIRNHYFVPGFPVMAWPMIESVLDTRFAHLFHRERRGERSFLVYELAESTATPLMEEIERAFPGIRVFSLPSMGEDGVRRHIELGVKGAVQWLDAACARLEAGVRALGGEIR